MNIEYELKYSATPQILEAVQAELGGRWTQYKMQTTYYDALDGALSARKWTLRRRLENGVSVCTLKTPGQQGRMEYETVCNSIEDGILELCKLGAPDALLALTKDGVRQICGAAFTRFAQQIDLKGGAVEVALDTGMLFAGEKQLPLCELEVELKTGDPAVADGFAQELSQKYGLQVEKQSKFKRALALTR